ncbi:MAG TPA: hypothetical protein OIM59_18460 [Bacteroides mediterraneensis]|nr:hypothetical protein [Bacteroides mediterraneensis]HJH66553.1 hypothetical protein [Bacteroides mediterraneensis]
MRFCGWGKDSGSSGWFTVLEAMCGSCLMSVGDMVFRGNRVEEGERTNV